VCEDDDLLGVVPFSPAHVDGVARARARRGAGAVKAPDDDQHALLLTFRTELRTFVRWSEEAARAAGLTPALHQLLLAVRGDRSSEGPTVGSVAEALLVRSHTAGELVQRAEERGLLTRARDDEDHRRVHSR
jgi:hypothetical protein